MNASVSIRGNLGDVPFPKPDQVGPRNHHMAFSPPALSGEMEALGCHFLRRRDLTNGSLQARNNMPSDAGGYIQMEYPVLVEGAGFNPEGITSGMRPRALGVCVVLLGAMIIAFAPVTAFAQTCAPPAGFVDKPHPEIAPVEKLVSHTEEIDIDRPLAVVLDEAAKTKLEDAIDRKSSLPGVSGTYKLTEAEFGQPGSRRLTCLTDGSTLVEQVLVRERKPDSFRFRYVVWNYTTEKARPIVYGMGEFLYSNAGNTRTHVRWRYSFQLNRHRFPGFLGPIGDFLFRVGFLDREYAEMMRNTLAGNKARAGSTSPTNYPATVADEARKQIASHKQ